MLVCVRQVLLCVVGNAVSHFDIFKNFSLSFVLLYWQGIVLLACLQACCLSDDNHCVYICKSAMINERLLAGALDHDHSIHLV